MGETATGQDTGEVKTKERIVVFTALALLTLVTFAWFPGHTWLQSDTQIYVAIFEHLEDPSVLANDLVATRPHVTWTIYDETARWLHALTGASFRDVLFGEQVVFRFFGLLGVFLIAHSCGLKSAGALFTAAAFGLGAVINGPAVLTLEYEPVPRGFAIMLLMAAIGFGAKERWNLAEVFAGVATLYHAPTTAPFWACTLVWWLLKRDAVERLRLLAWALGAAVVLLIFAMLQQGQTESQPLFGRIDPALESLQRLRGAYNWIGLWPPSWFWQYPLLLGVVVLAWRRLKDALSPKVRWFSVALPVFGLLMVALQWLLLDKLKWILIPQMQPARAVLFITAFAVILCSIAAWRSGAEGRWRESAAWLFVVFAVPANGRVLELIYGLGDPLIAKRLALVALMALAVAWLIRWSETKSPVIVLAAIALPLLVLPGPAQVQTYPDLHPPELYELVAWANKNTRKEDVFQFADAHRALAPGIFRVEAQRALYVDWKGGGQVNLLKQFAEQWWQRWQAVNEAKPPLRPLEDYRALGIDYLVVAPKNRPAGTSPAFANSAYEVIALR